MQKKSYNMKYFKASKARGGANTGNQVKPTNEYKEFKKEDIFQSISNRFQQQVNTYGHKVAVKSQELQLTYDALNQFANRVAHSVLGNYDDQFRLNSNERIRYSRQIILHKWGMESQEKLKRTTVFCAGAGGSGSPLIMQLALAGFGKIIICDFDEVELSNLNRQVLHDESRIGMNKALSAAKSVQQINPNIEVVVYQEKVTRENIRQLAKGSDFIFDNVDDMEAKFVLSQYAVEKQIPHIISSMIDMNSYAAILHSPHTPCFHCLNDRGVLAEVEEMKKVVKDYKKNPNPVVSPSLFLATAFAVNEAIKIVLGLDEQKSAYNKYFFFNQRGTDNIIDADSYRLITYSYGSHFRKISKEQGFDWEEGWSGGFLDEIEICHDPGCPACGDHSLLELLPDSLADVSPLTFGPGIISGEADESSEDNQSQPLQTVGLLFEHGPQMIVGLMGVLKSGKIYVPLDPGYPEERLDYQLSDSDARLIVTNNKNYELACRLRDRVNKHIGIVNIDNIIKDKAYSDANPSITIDPSQLAYILYTSGSTGKPKGVMQNHRNVLHFCRVYTNALHLNDSDRLSVFSSYGFDAAKMDIYGALLNGGTLYPYDIKEEDNLSQMARWLRRERITIYHSIPTVYRYFTDMLNGEDQFPYIRFIVLGGEAVFKKDIDTYKKHFSDDCLFINGLGPTESTVTIQYFMDKKSQVKREAVPVGYAVTETDVLLLDENDKEAMGTGIGEIVYKSDYLALGYLNNKSKTDEVFVPNPLSGKDRVYRSGDLGRRLKDGAIEYAGRKDFQVKIRGYRVELGEIEGRLDSFAGIKKSAVVCKQDNNGENYLTAYYVVSEESGVLTEVNEFSLVEMLQESVPDYMVPGAFYRLDEFPLTATGKIDRKTLSQSTETHIVSIVEYVEPEGPIEIKLAEIWKELLSVDQIGAYDNFFVLGGHSLKATMLVSKIHKAFDVKVSLAEVFTLRTIRDLATHISKSTKDVFTSLEKAPKMEYYPLSSAQHRMFVVHQLAEGSTGNNLPSVVQLEGNLDIKRLVSAFDTMIERHESFCTSFHMQDDDAVQIIHEAIPFKIEGVVSYDGEISPISRDTTSVHLPVIDDEDVISHAVKSFIRPFDLAQAPLLRAGLIRNGQDHYVLMTDMHHIISDGISISLFVREFMALYAGESLLPLTYQYKDYSYWNNSESRKQAIASQEVYWLDVFSGEIPVIELPYDFPRPSVQSFDGSIERILIDEDLTGELKELAKENDITLFMLLIAFVDVWLAKLSGQEDIVVGTPIAGRNHPNLERIIGMFVNTLALRSRPSGDITFDCFLTQVKSYVLNAFENQDYQFETLVETLDLLRDTSRNPLFDITFRLRNIDFQTEDIPAVSIEGLKLKPYSFERHTTQFDLGVIARDTHRGLEFNLEYSTMLFTSDTIVRFGEFLKNILVQVAKAPDIPIAKISIISDAEKETVLTRFNDMDAPTTADTPIHRLFEEQVERTPENVAVVAPDNDGQALLTVTYRQLNQWANRLAGRLAVSGIGSGDIVGVFMEPSRELIVGLLGILKTGAAYLAIDPTYPASRVEYMMQDSAAAAVVADETSFDHAGLADSVAPQCMFAPIFESEDSTDIHDLGCQVTASDPLYVIYTSGSTGKPKGVLVGHRSFVNLIACHKEVFGENEESRMSQVAGPAFDAMAFEVWPCLLNGAALYIADKDTRMDPVAMRDWLIENAITISFQSTMMAEHLLRLEWPETGVALRELRTAGDRLNVYPQRDLPFRFFNLYGPTEDTVWTTWYEVPVRRAAESTEQGDLPPIGKPVGNHRIFVLDKYMNPQPIGLVGELCVAGSGLAFGYLNRPELTSDNFVEAEHLSLPGRLYKTGDLACWLSDGNLQFVGRIDHQVKIRGFRIELGEIENRLAAHVKIREVIVLAIDEAGGAKSLCAYIVANEDIPPSRLTEFLKKDLPDYMVPTYFLFIDSIPVTPNGKVDRKMLPLPDKEYSSGGEYVAPRSDLERKMVDIWQSVLGRERVGIHDDFFLLGGDSIKTIQIAARMKQDGYTLSMKDFFQHSTIAELAAAVKETSRSIDQSVVKGTVPLTPIQEWFFKTITIDNHHFNQSMMLMFDKGESLGEDVVRVVFTKLLEHHDALRMTYRNENGSIIQTNKGLEQSFSLQVFDYREYEDHSAAVNALEDKAGEIQSGINLESGPLMQVALFHLDDGDRLLMVIHHLVIDGVSWRIILEDLETLFSQCRNGDQPTLPLKTDSFKYWAEELGEYADSMLFLKEKPFWKSLESIDITALPVDFPTESNLRKGMQRLTFQLSEEETHLLLTKTNKPFGTEINDILLSGLGLAVKKIWGQNRIAIHLEGHGREDILDDVDITRTVGWFTSLYPVIVETTAEDDYARQVIQVKEAIRRIPQKGIGYGILKYLTSNENKDDMTFALMPQIGFNYLGQFDADVQQKTFKIAGEATGGDVSPRGLSNHELEISGMIANNRLNLGIFFNKNRYKMETMDALKSVYAEELKKIIDFCAGIEERVLTPSDLTYGELSFDEVEELRRRYPLEDVYPLSPMQEGMYFHTQFDGASGAYFEQAAYRLHGELNIGKVEKSLNELLKRHEILRTAFVQLPQSGLLQVVLQKREVGFLYKDISSEPDPNAYIKNFREKDRNRSFDLAADVLMRVAVLRIGPEEYEFVWGFNHMLMDGWCITIILKEYFEIYNSFIEGRSYQLPAVVQYRTYIRWLMGKDKEISGNYWKEYLQGYEDAVVIPSRDITGRGAGSYRHGNVTLEVAKEKSDIIDRLASQNKVTINTFIQSVWGIVMGIYNGTEDVVFGSVVSGRPPEIEGVETMVGLFINTVPVRVRFQGDSRVVDLIRTVQQEAVDSESHHYYPMADIQAQSFLKQDLLDHILVFENYPVTEQITGMEASGGGDGSDDRGKRTPAIRVSNADMFEQTNYDFNIIITHQDRIKIHFDFNESVYKREIIEAVALHLERVIDQAAADGNTLIRQIVLVSDEEKRQLVMDFNDTRVEYSTDTTLHDLFEEQVLKCPNGIALEYNDQTLTYEELQRVTDRLAINLRDAGVSTDIIVGVLCERSIDAVVFIMGILKAGGAYLPIDRSYPVDRKTYIIKNSGIKILLTEEDLNAEEIHMLENIPNVESMRVDYRVLKDEPPISGFIKTEMKGDNLAYVIYTSGTTGNPKGSLLRHRNVVNYLRWAAKSYVKGENVDFPLFTSLSFDLTVTSLFLPLVTGNKLVIYRETKTGMLIEDVVKDNRVNVIKLTPSHLKVIKELHCDTSQIKRFIVGGEELKTDVAAAINEYFNGNIEIYNEYGPTETAVGCMIHRYNPDIDTAATVPIGVPADNTEIYILDKHKRVMPVGIVGEIYIGGKGVARGYLNDETLTAKKFIDNPFKPGEKMYRSGDLGRWNSDKKLEFFGRYDEQVKIRGFRIEPGEIESRLVNHPQVNEALVIDREKNGDNYLYAYIVPSSIKEPPEATVIKEYLNKTLPDYMIPAFVVSMERIPITANGKVDKKSLPEPWRQITADSYTAPRDDFERKLAVVWAEVLDLDSDQISLDSDFFELGGHSIKVMMLASHIHKEFSVKLSLPDIFKLRTLREMSERIRNTQETRFVDVEPVEKKEYYELSYNQKRMWLMSQLDPGNASFNMPGAITLGTNADIEAVKKSLAILARKHEAFRISFKEVAGKPVQVIADQVAIPIEIIDLSHLDEEALSAKKRRIQDKDALMPFDLSIAPLFRVSLLKLPGDRWDFLFNIHHIISDGWSHALLTRDFSSFYRSYSNGEDIEFIPLKLQYKDFAEWANRRILDPDLKEAAHRFWMEKMENEITQFQLPYDFSADKNDYRGSGYVAFIPDSIGKSLEKIASNNNTTLFMVMYAAFNWLMGRFSGNETIVSSIISAGRDHVALQDIVGCFINSIVAANTVDWEEGFDDFLQRIAGDIMDSFETQAYPMELVLDDLGLSYPDVPVSFNMLNMEGDTTGDELNSTDPYHLTDLPVVKFNLALHVDEFINGIRFKWVYRKALFRPETIEYIANAYIEILNIITSD